MGNSILSTITELFSSLFSSIDNSIYTALDEISFIDTNILHSTYLEKLFGNATSNRDFVNFKCDFNRFCLIFCS